MTNKILKAEQLGRQVSRVPRLWRAILDERLAPLGLTQTRWMTLYCLYKGHQGSVQRELASVVGVEAPSLVRTLNQLASQGLIERRTCGGDRRSKRIYLTHKAAPLLQKIQDVVSQSRLEMLEGLDEDEVEQLVALMTRIDANCQNLLK